MIKLIFILMIVCSNIFAGKINVAAASNVNFVMEELIKEFNKTNPNIQVSITLGSSAKLSTQIKNGAPYNIFMSANMEFPQALYDENIAFTKPVIYAQGLLAMISTKELNFKEGLNLLKNDSISKIAIANPKTAPYGVSTIEALQNAKIYDAIKNKFIYAESISQVVSYTMIASNIGIIAKSSLYEESMKKYKENINWISIDSSLYTPINQGIVMINNSKENDEVKAFYDFILSAYAKEIFKKFGYLVK